MNGRADKDKQTLTCAHCLEGLQEYLDGTLEKSRSLEFFVHLRDCPGCQRELESLKGVFTLLDGLPDREVPADFDRAVLASVPYASYRAMEPLRRQRIPVFLEREALPGFVRSPLIRRLGLAVAVAAAAVGLAVDGAQWSLPVAFLGALPEILVRLQDLGRRAVTAMRRSES